MMEVDKVQRKDCGGRRLAQGPRTVQRHFLGPLFVPLESGRSSGPLESNLTNCARNVYDSLTQ